MTGLMQVECCREGDDETNDGVDDNGVSVWRVVESNDDNCGGQMRAGLDQQQSRKN